jgi:hypothetical protein
MLFIFVNMTDGTPPHRCQARQKDDYTHESSQLHTS